MCSGSGPGLRDLRCSSRSGLRKLRCSGRSGLRIVWLGRSGGLQLVRWFGPGGRFGSDPGSGPGPGCFDPGH